MQCNTYTRFGLGDMVTILMNYIVWDKMEITIDLVVQISLCSRNTE